MIVKFQRYGASGFGNQNSTLIPGGNGDTGSTCRNTAGHIRDSNGIQVTDIVVSIVGYSTGVNRWNLDAVIRAALDIGNHDF